MAFNIYIILGISVIFCVTCNSPFAHAMVGMNIRKAERGEFPSVVSIMNRNDANPQPQIDHLCTGTLITSSHIITVAKCLENRLYNDTMVLVGTTSLIYGRVYYVKWWVTYNQYMEYKQRRPRHLENNLAIIRLFRFVDNDVVPSIVAPLSPEVLSGHEATLVGWGESNNGEVSVDLLTNNVRILPRSECVNKLVMMEGHEVFLDTRLLCTASHPFVLIYDGELGGPLMYRNMIIAVNIGTRPFPELHFHQDKLNMHLAMESFRPYITDVTKAVFEWP